jgi:UDP-N-acetylglucosamine diphosphorylase / glucose-1-phosphate thymidylyltransferase / UDP-N-acetylgalactosamine diphosphorylase / glucosamine-1-phosphate N-acetyltransferase / galactosamine-1-phosphate N-acetyltransferase
MINVLIPMAGAGSRFAKAGFALPKPFIDVAGRPMIGRVLENLALDVANYILIGRVEHLASQQGIVADIKAAGNVRFIGIDRLTEGTVCTVLHAHDLIHSDRPLVIANSDQIVDFRFTDFIADAVRRRLDGSILVFKDRHKNPKWSFVRLNDDGYVVEAKEKDPISDLATVGIYYFASGKQFIRAAIEMIVSNDRVNGEFYTCPVYNYLASRGAKVGVFEIDATAMHGVGTPEDLDIYLRHLNIG